jgi:hypothetical protein
MNNINFDRLPLRSLAEMVEDASVMPDPFNTITTEQLLLAAAVLSAQNPQGPGFNQAELLQAAYDFVAEAQVAASSFYAYKSMKNGFLSEIRSKFGYDRPNRGDLVPFELAAQKITGLKSKQAVPRFERFIDKHSVLSKVKADIMEHGVRKDQIPEFAEEEKAFFAEWRSRQNRASAKRPRKKSRNSKKALASPSAQLKASR